MEQATNDPRRNRIIKAAFGGTLPDKSKMEALYVLFDYIEKNGTKTPDVQPDMKKEKLVSRLDCTLRKHYGTDLYNLMHSGRERGNTLLKYFCYGTFKNIYPFVSDKEIAQALGNTKARVTVNIAIRKLRSDLVYDAETAVKYGQFRKHFDDAFLPARQSDNIGCWAQE